MANGDAPGRGERDVRADRGATDAAYRRARAALLESLVSDTESYVIARVELDHHREVLRTDGTVEIVVRVARVGRSSLEVEHDVVRADGTLAASGRSVLVRWDLRARRSRSLTDEERALLGG